MRLRTAQTLTLAGHSDWRLPSLIELVSIVDYGQYNPSISRHVFPLDTRICFLVFVCRSAGSPSLAWYVDFFDGSTNGVASDTDYVRCVR